MSWAAVIAAGGKEEGSFATAMGSPHKALARFKGHTSLARVLNVLAKTECSRVAVVGPSAVQAHCQGAQFVPEGNHAVENVALGMAAIPGFGQYLMLPADSPDLNADDINRFMRRFTGGAAVSLTTLDKFRRAYPDVPTKALRLREGHFLSGAIFACDDRSFVTLTKSVAEFREKRKSPLAMVGKFGWGNLVRYMLGRLDREQAEAIIANTLGVSRVWIDLDGHPGLALDFDTEQEYRLLQQYVN
ncbi:MAG: nucleotidyltransferase family protein [Chthonomonas sp.]|nr:nucleotidyltransferase family protein [Chthonomonas sp.]